MRAHLLAAAVVLAVPSAALSQAQSPKACLPGEDQLAIARSQAAMRSQSPTPQSIDWSKVAMPTPGRTPSIAATRNAPEKLLPCAQTAANGLPK